MLSPLQYDTLDHFIAWLETRDPTEVFNLMCVNVCVLGQYDSAHGVAPQSPVCERFGGLGMAIIVGRDDLLRKNSEERQYYLEHIPFGDVLKRAKEVRGW